jgi:CheY-like chemotaxis protein/two-component sensor histidine kinase
MDRQLSLMVHLIDDLLDVSRIGRGTIVLKKERVHLAAVIQQAVETSRPLIEEAGHELSISVPTDPIPVDADPTRLVQVLSNLLNNAAKFTERGGRIALSVALTPGPSVPSGTTAIVSVKDNGVGIPAHMLDSIFDLFTQADRSLERSQGGLGVGLSLVRTLVELHGGSVEARSEGRGMGSEFVVRLPLALGYVAEQRGEKHDLLGPIAGSRILVVDDNQDSAVSLARLLEIMGNQTEVAYDGLAALDVAAKFQPDVILLDIGMPGLNGYETARRVRGEPWGEKVVLVALSGWGQEEDRRRSQEAGFQSHLVKPVEPAALGKLLAQFQTPSPT